MSKVCIRLMEESMQFVLCQILYLSIHYSMYAAITSQIAQNVQISALALTLYCKYPWPSTSDTSYTASHSYLSTGSIPSSALCFHPYFCLILNGSSCGVPPTPFFMKCTDFSPSTICCKSLFVFLYMACFLYWLVLST